MTEPLAATLLVGRGAGDPLGGGRGAARGAGSCRGCCSARWPWSGPSTWRSGPRCSALVAPRSTQAPGWRLARAALVAGRGAASLGFVVVVAPWTVRNAVALDRFVPISTGGGQVLYVGHLPALGRRPGKGRGRRWSREHPAALRRPRAARALRARADPRPPRPRPAPPGLEPTRRSRGWAGNSSGTTRDRTAARPAGLVAAKIGRSGASGLATSCATPRWEPCTSRSLVAGLLGLACSPSSGAGRRCSSGCLRSRSP